MNKLNTLFYLFAITLINFNCTAQLKSENRTDTELKYSNLEYNFEVSVPKKWKLYHEIKNDSIKQFAIVDWGLPKLYSKIEKTEIENSISIRAYLNETNISIKNVIEKEYLRINSSNTSLKKEKGIANNARIIYYTAQNGAKYKGKSYFEWKNGVSYVLTFMATPGTYDTNLIKFEKLYSTFNIK